MRCESFLPRCPCQAAAGPENAENAVIGDEVMDGEAE